MQVIDLGNGYRLRRFDDLNWTLERFRRPSAARRSKSDEPRWFGTDRYFQTLGAGLAAAYEFALRDGEDATDLATAMLRAQGLHDDLMAVRTSLTEVRAI